MILFMLVPRPTPPDRERERATTHRDREGKTRCAWGRKREESAFFTGRGVSFFPPSLSLRFFSSDCCENNPYLQFFFLSYYPAEAMFLKRRASKLLGIKAEKFILTVEILDLHVDLARAEKAEPKPLPGASYVLCLEKRGRSATSAKRTIALDQSGVNPLAEGRVSTTLLSAFSIPVLERLQMIITLYKDSSSSSGYRNKTVKIVWKVFQSDPVLGIEICPPFAVAALRVDELVAKDINLNGETELTIPFDGLPNSFVKLRASAVSIAATAGDEGEEASSGSEVGFDYDDLLIAEEHSTPN
eukprot:scaffold4868_cov135-Ochromonas_danica.AAC.1